MSVEYLIHALLSKLMVFYRMSLYEENVFIIPTMLS